MEQQTPIASLCEGLVCSRARHCVRHRRRRRLRVHRRRPEQSVPGDPAWRPPHQPSHGGTRVVPHHAGRRRAARVQGGVLVSHGLCTFSLSCPEATSQAHGAAAFVRWGLQRRQFPGGTQLHPARSVQCSWCAASRCAPLHNDPSTQSSPSPRQASTGCGRDLPDGHEVFEGLGHLEPLNVQVAAVEEVVHPLLAAAEERGGGGASDKTTRVRCCTWAGASSTCGRACRRQRTPACGLYLPTAKWGSVRTDASFTANPPPLSLPSACTTYPYRRNRCLRNDLHASGRLITPPAGHGSYLQCAPPQCGPAESEYCPGPTVAAEATPFAPMPAPPPSPPPPPTPLPPCPRQLLPLLTRPGSNGTRQSPPPPSPVGHPPLPCPPASASPTHFRRSGGQLHALTPNPHS